jgi:hypothetical protein
LIVRFERRIKMKENIKKEKPSCTECSHMHYHEGEGYRCDKAGRSCKNYSKFEPREKQ